MFIRIISNIIIFSCLFLDIGISQNNFTRVSSKKAKLGTMIHIMAYTDSESECKSVIDNAFYLLDSLNQIFSDYDPTSEVFQINKNCQKRIVNGSPELMKLLTKSLELANLSKGLFDPTLGRLTHLWRRYKKKNKLPPNRKLKRANRHTGYQHIRLNQDSTEIEFLRSKIKLDFGGIAKGYLADRISAYLKEHGVPKHFIDMGGDIVLGAPPPNTSGWSIRIPGCNSPVLLANVGLAGSGSTYQFIETNQSQHSHIISNQEQSGVTHKLKTAVIANYGIWADGFATAINASQNKWTPLELIHTVNGFFIHKGDEVFFTYFNDYIHDQIKLCE